MIVSIYVPEIMYKELSNKELTRIEKKLSDIDAFNRIQYHIVSYPELKEKDYLILDSFTQMLVDNNRLQKNSDEFETLKASLENIKGVLK